MKKDPSVSFIVAVCFLMVISLGVSIVVGIGAWKWLVANGHLTGFLIGTGVAFFAKVWLHLWRDDAKRYYRD